MHAMQAACIASHVSRGLFALVQIKAAKGIAASSIQQHSIQI
jgi:hypothetical protein